MTDDKKDHSERVLSSIFDPDDSELNDLKAELTSEGLDIAGLTKNVRSMIDDAKRDLRHSWLSAAKKGAEEFKQRAAKENQERIGTLPWRGVGKDFKGIERPLFEDWMKTTMTDLDIAIKNLELSDNDE